MGCPVAFCVGNSQATGEGTMQADGKAGRAKHLEPFVSERLARHKANIPSSARGSRQISEAGASEPLTAANPYRNPTRPMR